MSSYPRVHHRSLDEGVYHEPSATKNTVKRTKVNTSIEEYARASKLHYDPHTTYAERIADRDSRVLPNEWEFLVKYWNSDSALDRSAKNKATRKKQDITHTAGTKCFARFAIQKFSSHHPKIVQKNISRDDLLVMALGEKKCGNYVRCCRLGAAPSEVFGPNPTRAECLRMLSETKRIAEEKKHVTQKEIVEMRQEILMIRAKLETIEKRSQDLNTIEDRDIPSNPIGTSNPIGSAQVNSSCKNNIPSEEPPSNEMQFSESNFEEVHTMLDNGGGVEVYLKSLRKPHKYIAQGSLFSTNPNTKIDGAELRSQCWEVQINVPIEPNEPLLRSYGSFQTIRNADLSCIAIGGSVGELEFPP
uniref:Transposase Tnp1/En/Spm-like domain-containing protein n=1 Tax=Ananas comosus var. bracteatus TaxID=296719 RepID=A0A6V7QW73_ANACO